MAEPEKTFSVTTTHYRQLDFLRLFKLAKSLGLVKRKRKMPVDYATVGDDNKTQVDSRSACRRLLRMVVQHIFPNFQLNSNWNHYFLTFPLDQKNALTFITQNLGRLETSYDRTTRDAITGYREIMTHVDGFIYPALPHQIKIRLSAIRSTNLRSDGYKFLRPQECFYQCAMACIQYKELLEKHMSTIVNVAKAQQEIIDKERQARQNIRGIARTFAVMEPTDYISAISASAEEFIIEPDNSANIEEVSRLVGEIQTAREERLRNAQGAFDQVLANFLQQGDQG